MGNRNIKKETKKPKKSDKKSVDTAAFSAPRAITTPPVLIKKEKKIK